MEVQMNKEDILFILDSLKLEDPNPRDYSKVKIRESLEKNNFSEDDISYLIEYLDDLFLMHGLDSDFEPNELGLRAESLRDYLYSISN